MDRQEQLEELREMLEQDADLCPSELVREWRGWRPAYEYDAVEERENVWVDVDDIVGTDPMNTSRLVERRLVKIVNMMAEGDWDPVYDTVVLAEHPNGELFVTSDGNHRVLAHKFFGYERILADVTRYVPKDVGDR